MLKIQRNFPFPSEVQQRRQWVNVANPSQNHREEGHHDEGNGPVVVREREHWHSNVTEDEVLREKAQQFEGELGMVLRFAWKIIVRVVSLEDSAEKDRDDSRELRGFGD